MRLKVLAFATVAVFVTVPAVAQTPTDTATPAPKEKKVCRQYAVTGSIVPTKTVCHTRAEWAQIDDANARSPDNMLGNTRTPK